MSDEQPNELSGGNRQIDEAQLEEMITIPKKAFEGMAQNIHFLSDQVELLGGLIRLALPMLGGPLIFTQEVLEEEIDRLAVNVHKAKDILSAKDAFNFGLQLKLDMNLAFVAIVEQRDHKEVKKRKFNRAAAKAAAEAAQKAQEEANPKEEEAASTPPEGKTKKHLTMLG